MASPSMLVAGASIELNVCYTSLCVVGRLLSFSPPRESTQEIVSCVALMALMPLIKTKDLKKCRRTFVLTRTISKTK